MNPFSTSLEWSYLSVNLLITALSVGLHLKAFCISPNIIAYATTLSFLVHCASKANLNVVMGEFILCRKNCIKSPKFLL